MEKRIKILHLESSPSDALLISNALDKGNILYERLVVDTKDRYIHALKNFLPDIILADHSPDLLSLNEALTISLQTGIKIPFIIVTAEISDELAADLIMKGADDYIFKDRLGRLPIAIRSVLTKLRIEEENRDFLDQLANSEKRYRALVESSADAVVILSAEGKPSYVSHSVKNVLGYTQEQAMNMDLLTLAHPDDLEALAGVLKQVLAEPGKAIKGHTGRMLHANGSWRWIEATVNNLLHDPVVNGIVDNFRDVTETKLAEDAIISNEHKFRSLIENSADGMSIISRHGKPLYISPSIKNVLGYSEQERMHLDMLKLIHPDDIQPLLGIMGQVMANPGVAINGPATRTKHKDGSWRWIESVLTNMLHEPYISGIVSNYRDVTDRKQSEEKILHLNRLYAFLSQINQTLVHAHDAQTVFREACRIACETGKFKAAWIGIIDEKNEQVDFVEGYGIAANDLGAIVSAGCEDILQNKVLQNGGYYVCNNIQKDSLSERWKLLAAEAGYGSCIILPIKKSGFVTGSFNLNASELDFFTSEEIALLVEAAGDISFALDIFEKERLKLLAEKRLKHNEYRLIQAQAIAHLGSWEIDFSNGIGIWSDEACRIYGLSIEDNIQPYESWMSFIHPEDVDYVMKMIKEAKASLTTSAIDHRIVRKDGTVRHVYSQTQFEIDTDGKLIGLHGVVHDITEIRKSQEALRISESNLQAIFENTSEGFILTDRQGTIKYFNNKSRDFIELNTGKEIRAGESLFDLIDESRKKNYVEAITQVLFGKNWQYEYSYTRKNGKQDWFEVNVNPVYAENQITGLSITIAEITERKQAEEGSRFRANLLNTIGQAAIATDINGIVNYWNKAAEEIYGWTEQEAIGRNITDLTPSHASKDREMQIMDALNQGHTWSGEFRVGRKDGTYFPAMVTDTPIYDQHQQLTGIIGISSDITEKKALEVLLDEVTSLARIGGYEVDLENESLYWSPMTKQIHEVEIDYVPQVKSGIAFYKEGPSREAISRAYNDAIEKNIPFDLELPIITAKGNERWVRVIGEAEHLNGKCIRLYGSFQDIDKMKMSELEVLKAYEEKNIILESIGDAFFAVDRNWIVTYWNKEAEIVLDCPKQKILGENIWDVFSDAVNSSFYIHYHRAVEQNSIQHFEAYYQRQDRWFDVTAYPSVNGLSVYFRDVTERILSGKRLRELNDNLQSYTHELTLSNKGLEQFSYIVSHNLRAPVANIIGLAGLIGQDVYPPEVKDEFLHGILTNVKRLDDVIVDLNTILQVKREVSEKKESVNLQELVDNIQSSIQVIILKEQVQIQTDFRMVSQLTTLKSYLHSIFYNLIMNSIKYRQPGLSPVIEVKSRLSHGKIEISFRDNGMGIDLSKKKDQVFGLYKRFHHHVEGKGMGLFMVKTQLEMLGGKISVKSEINKGTEFLIEFKSDDYLNSEK